mgnify:CR=1 FL=1
MLRTFFMIGCTFLINARKLNGFFVLHPKQIPLTLLKMPYVTTGAVHHSGVSNEKTLVQYANEHQYLNINRRLCGSEGQAIWSHLGGTKQKADCKATIGSVDHLISIKHHESSGTFDWINTSKLDSVEPTLSSELKPKIASFKEKYNNQDVTAEMRIEMENIFNGAFENIGSDHIKKLLRDLYEKYPPWILINHKSENQFIMYNKENNFSEFLQDEDWEYYLVSMRGKTSRMIFRKKDGVVVNTNLRLRLVLNNGINALVGKSNSNKTSVPCLKIQQDRVNQLLANLNDATIDTIN